MLLLQLYLMVAFQICEGFSANLRWRDLSHYAHNTYYNKQHNIFHKFFHNGSYGLVWSTNNKISANSCERDIKSITCIKIGFYCMTKKKPQKNVQADSLEFDLNMIDIIILLVRCVCDCSYNWMAYGKLSASISKLWTYNFSKSFTYIVLTNQQHRDSMF